MSERTSARIARNASIQAGAEVVSKVASLAFYVVMARVLGVDGFGAFTFALSLAMLLTVLADLGTDTILTRDVARSRDRIHHLFWNSIALRAAAGVVALAVALGIVALGDYEGQTRVAVVLLIFAVLVELFSKTLYGAFRAYEDMGPIASAIMTQRIFTAAIGIAAMAAGGDVVVASVVYLAGALLALALAARALVGRHGRPRFQVSYVAAKELAIVALPMGIAGIFYTMLARIDATMLALIDDEAAVGIYGAAYRLLESTAFISFAFVSAAMPTLSRLTRASTPPVATAVEGVAKGLALILFPIGAVFALFAAPLVDLLYGAKYADAVTVLRLLGAATAIYGLSYLASYVLVSQDRQRVVPWVVAAVTALKIGLNVVLIDAYSYDGAALATSLAELAVLVALSYFALRAVGRVSPARVLAGPLAGVAAMGLAALALGMGWLGLAVALPAYALAVLAVERRFFPQDLELIAGIVRRRLVARARPSA